MASSEAIPVTDVSGGDDDVVVDITTEDLPRCKEAQLNFLKDLENECREKFPPSITLSNNTFFYDNPRVLKKEIETWFRNKGDRPFGFRIQGRSIQCRNHDGPRRGVRSKKKEQNSHFDPLREIDIPLPKKRRRRRSTNRCGCLFSIKFANPTKRCIELNPALDANSIRITDGSVYAHADECYPCAEEIETTNIKSNTDNENTTEDSNENTVLVGIHLIQCGGTIDKDYPSPLHGYAFEITNAASERILGKVSTAYPVSSVTTVCRKDSLEMTEEDRDKLREVCKESKYSKVLITHGTSTMVQTAQHLAEEFNSTRRIVITGSLLPDKFRDSDAAFNVGCAVGALLTSDEPGIFIAMSGAVYQYDQVARDPKGRFVSINHPLAQAGDDPGIKHFLSQKKKPED